MTVIGIVLCLVALVVGVVAGMMMFGKQQSAVPEAERAKLVDAARAEAAEVKRAAQLEAKELALKAQAQAADELKQRRQELQKAEEALRRREEELAKKSGTLQGREAEFDKKEKTVAGREQAAEATARRAEELLNESKAKLEKLAGMSADDARKELMSQVVDEAKKAAAVEVKKIEDEARTEAEERSKRILGTAIQRYAGEYVSERTVSVVPLPSDDLKGRIIGREGRNIRALEMATGCDLIVDDTPEAILVSAFDGFRREVAKHAILRLISDGRIHPARIEEIVEKTRVDLETQVLRDGENAAIEIGVHEVNPELLRLLGKLRYRTSYGQNVLSHSKEVAMLAGLMAAEIGAKEQIARRAGLLHDIGKAVDKESGGSHLEWSVDFARKYGETPEVIHAIACHHLDIPFETAEAVLVQAADTISAARPGARREILENYIQRLERLEKIADSFTGVQKAYALQAGREIRILVDSTNVGDQEAVWLSKDIARKIEAELQYPGQIKVTVIREMRAVDFAK